MAIEQPHGLVNSILVVLKLTRGTGDKLTGIEQVLKSYKETSVEFWRSKCNI